jgi:hypothetical protein
MWTNWLTKIRNASTPGRSMMKLLKKIIQKIIPLRASVYEKSRVEMLAEIRQLQKDNKKQQAFNTKLLKRLETADKQNKSIIQKTEESAYILTEFRKEFAVHNSKLQVADNKLNNLDSKIAFIVKQNTKDYDYYISLHPSKYEEALREWFYRKTGEILDLENPKTYNQKIQWLKLKDNNPLKGVLSDKYLAREWVAQKIGDKHLVPLYGVWDNFDEIDFAKLPEKFVLKATHGCAMNIVVKDKSLFDIEEARAKFSDWTNTHFAFRNGLELHYNDTAPRIIAEEYIENFDGELYDYKVFCFNGKAKYSEFMSGRFEDEGSKRTFYDTEWNLQPFTSLAPQYNAKIEKPEKLDLMINLAETLSEGFPHVRVDFYIPNTGELLFGEMTFTPASGACKWDPPKYNAILGDMIDLTKATR